MAFMDSVVAEWLTIGLSAASFILIAKLLFLGTPLRGIKGISNAVAAI